MYLEGETCLSSSTHKQSSEILGNKRQDVLLLLFCLVFSQLTPCFYRKGGSQSTAPVISCGVNVKDRCGYGHPPTPVLHWGVLCIAVSESRRFQTSFGSRNIQNAFKSNSIPTLKGMIITWLERGYKLTLQWHPYCYINASKQCSLYLKLTQHCTSIMPQLKKFLSINKYLIKHEKEFLRHRSSGRNHTKNFIDYAV